ncbi:hypothetical protein JGU66_17540 [Myxococcaceae bacterium JPH2]|nr:hypothetical protein [Myxococcaceae bacterium JPH2]
MSRRPGFAIAALWQPVLGFFQAMVSGTQALLLLALPGSRRRLSSGSDSSSRRDASLRHTVWRLRRAYDDVVGPHGIETLEEALGVLRTLTTDLGPAVLVWVDCVESLVQDAERRYGPGPGQGTKKAQDVKSALIHLLIDVPLVPGAPGFLQALIVETATNWAIDAVVMLLNRNEMWTAGQVVELSLPRRILRVLAAPLRWLDKGLSAVARAWVLRRAPLSPTAAAMVLKIQREKMLEPQVLTRGLGEMLRWVGTNRQRLIGFVDLVSVGTREAERFTRLSGPQKREYATDLVTMFLEQEGLLRNALLAPTIQWLIGIGIDLIVFLFNKRKVFQHTT